MIYTVINNMKYCSIMTAERRAKIWSVLTINCSDQWWLWLKSHWSVTLLNELSECQACFQSLGFQFPRASFVRTHKGNLIKIYEMWNHFWYWMWWLVNILSVISSSLLDIALYYFFYLTYTHFWTLVVYDQFLSRLKKLENKTRNISIFIVFMCFFEYKNWIFFRCCEHVWAHTSEHTCLCVRNCAVLNTKNSLVD